MQNLILYFAAIIRKYYMKYFFYSLLLLFAVILYGCPYESDVPIDEPAIPADKELFGKWSEVGVEKSYINVLAGGKNVYKLVNNSWDIELSSYQVQKCTAHMSEVKGIQFLNVRPEMKHGGAYYISRFAVNQSQDTIYLTPILETNSPKFTNSTELKAWISENINSEDIFDEYHVFARVE
jgi:hypothetical protein